MLRLRIASVEQGTRMIITKLKLLFLRHLTHYDEQHLLILRLWHVVPTIRLKCK
jgi:hypothetical protein